MIEKEILAICSICKKIRVDDEANLWLRRKDNPVLYDRLMDMFRGRLSHSYCPEDYQEIMKNLKI